MINMRSFLYVFLILFLASGCGMYKPISVETSPVEEPKVQKMEEKSSIEVTPEMVKEYAQLHQISDLKIAEYYLTHPEYAKENPYKPTEEDLVFYEREFLEKMYPEFKALAEKEGFIKARRMLMNNPPAGPGSFWVGSRRYGAVMQRLANEAGESAASGTKDILLQEDPVASNYQEAMRLYENNKIDDALQTMEKAAKAKPNSPTIQYNLGIMYMEKGNYAKAIQAMKNTISLIKETGYSNINLRMYPEVFLGSLNNLGSIYTRIGMHDEAINVLEEAVRFKPSDISANLNLGIAYYVKGDYDKANQQIRQYLLLEKDNAEAHNILGLIAYEKGLYEVALEEFRTAAKLDPSNKQFSYNEGLVLAKLGRNDEAKEAFKRSSGFKDGEDVRSTFIEEIEANKWRNMYNEGHTAMEFGNYNRAIEIFKSVLDIKPDLVEAHVNIGFSYRMKGDIKNQIYHYEEAVKLNPNNPDLHYNLGIAYFDAGKYNQAATELKIATELNPSSKDAHFNLGTTLFKLGNYNGAVTQFMKCIELNPDWFEARLNLGSSYIKLGKVQDAIEQFTEATKIKPRSAEAHYNLGVALIRSGKMKEASSVLQKAIELDPTHSMARATLKEIEAYNKN